MLPISSDKFERGFTEMIYVLGADHGGYIKRLEAVARAVSPGHAKLTVLLCQLVKIYRNGEPVRMSKRSGDFVTLARCCG
jgi:arginyl-tRNA synthetase